MKARQPLDVREWLQDMRRFNGRDADRATEVLQLLDEGEAYEQADLNLHDLMVEAGLLNANDYTTDPLPLLRMFLPVD